MITKFHFAVPRALTLLSVAVSMAFSASAANFRSTVTVKSDNPEAGVVCVTHATTKRSFLGKYTHTKPADPADSEYAAQVESMCISPGGGTAGEQRYYLYAKANPGYKFVKWEGGPTSGPVNTDQPYYEYTWTHYTKDTGSGAGITSTVTAYFVADNAVSTETNIPAGDITLEPAAPQIGDMCTATSTLRRIGQSGTVGNRNMMTRFSHWEDENGAVLSTDETFTFKVERQMTLRAVYDNLGEVPQKGKFYRVRNVYNRVLTLEGGYSFSISGAKDVPHTLLRWALPLDHDYSEFWTGTANNEWSVSDAANPICPEAEPGTIFYIADGASDATSLTGATLASQGVDTKMLTGQKLDVVPMSDNFCGYYGIRASSLTGAGFKTTVRNSEAFVNVSSFQTTEVFAAMALQPIDEEHMDDFWFGANPDESMNFDGGYWTSMYAAFPYECRDGVEAYYVSGAEQANGSTYATLTRIESGIVPAGSAVLLKCSGLTSKENRLLPLDPATHDIPALEGNALRGVYQLYSDASGNGRVKFDESTMRILGVNSKGEVGFYKLKAGDDGTPCELVANKVYLDMNALPGQQKSVVFKLRRGDDATTGIEAVDADASSVKYEDMQVFDLQGRPVVNPQAGKIYIVNGTKVQWR